MNFSKEIINWYWTNKRDLPWRNTTDPYIIWLSEIILQQTRVEQGTPYFFRFAENYPTVFDFASASENEILNHWQGLGYYSRGRNMHHTAKVIVNEYNGVFPIAYDELIKLKGIGEYTAAAIASFASNEAKAVVDGNVYRLFARYFGIFTPINSGQGKREFSDIANKLIDKKQPGTYNQAIMEFGSLQCRPKNPLCGTCPLRLDCVAFNNNSISELPVKLKSQKSRNRYFNYIVAISANSILINKRGPNDIWENLHDFPLIETPNLIDGRELIHNTQFIDNFGKNVYIEKCYVPVKHVLSHQNIYAQFFVINQFSDEFLHKNSWQYVPLSDLVHLAQPKLIFEFLKSFL